MLVTFGSEKPNATESRNTKLDIVLKDGSILTIRANVVPQIAESIHSVNLKSLDNWDCLWNEFSLADDILTLKGRHPLQGCSSKMITTWT